MTGKSKILRKTRLETMKKKEIMLYNKNWKVIETS